MHTLFHQFIDETFGGSQAKAADALECTRSLVCRIASGSRSVTPAMALRIEELSGGRFHKEDFIWPNQIAA